jgi:hypothetical protein
MPGNRCITTVLGGRTIVETRLQLATASAMHLFGETLCSKVQGEQMNFKRIVVTAFALLLVVASVQPSRKPARASSQVSRDKTGAASTRRSPSPRRTPARPATLWPMSVVPTVSMHQPRSLQLLTFNPGLRRRTRTISTTSPMSRLICHSKKQCKQKRQAERTK